MSGRADHDAVISVITVPGMHSRDLTLLQFAKMVGSYTGWGMRIEIVPDDELHLRPKRRVRIPKKSQRAFIRRRA
jgi:hypothetical protein